MYIIQYLQINVKCFVNLHGTIYICFSLKSVKKHIFVKIGSFFAGFFLLIITFYNKYIFFALKIFAFQNKKQKNT